MTNDKILSVLEKKVLHLLKKGCTQSEISVILKEEGIVPHSVSSVEKIVSRLKATYKAKTLYHLAIKVHNL